MSKNKKRRVSVCLSDNLRYTCDLKDWLAALNAAKERCDAEGLEDARIDIEYEIGYYDSVDISVHITAYRLETDEEYSLRTQEEKAQEEKRKQSEYQQYIGLKRKFEGRSNDKFK